MKLPLRSWKVIFKSHRYKDVPDTMVNSGYSYRPWVTSYVVARSKVSAVRQAREMHGWDNRETLDSMSGVKSCAVLEVLE